jgi:8-oxo-dGTP pyrophosphatase MutT (NUDIX family)
MSFLDHIALCNTHDLSNYVSLVVDGDAVGHIRKDNLAHLDRFPDVFVRSGQSVSLAPNIESYEDRTAAVDMVVRALFEDGVLTGWRGEPYPVGGQWGGPHAFEVERAAAPFFGARAYGVHINGYVRKENGLHMWIARRADDRPVCPGQFDNMIAGGQPVTLSLKENVIKEAGEEAGVPPDLAATALPTGAITYCAESDIGLKPDIMFCWDLELPADFMPLNADGEIAEFRLLPAAEVMEIVDTTFDFKFNCNLVIVDFCIRHGILPPEHPDYETILKGLRR